MRSEELVIKLLQQQFVVKIDDMYGGDVIDDFKFCVSQLKQLYKSIDIGQYLTITAFVGNFPYYKNNGKEMGMDNIHMISTKHLVINFVRDGAVIVVQDENFDPEILSDTTFVYKWDANSEYADQFYAKRNLIPFCEEGIPSEGSFFAVRTYNDLDEALIDYRDNIAISCKGKSLQESMTQSRLFFNPAPEDKLQEELDQFLRLRLRNCIVKREHNVDDSHPVDIIVTWQGTNHIALIEIKWLGKSLNKKGVIGVVCSDSKAEDGAEQLVNYIDNNTDSYTHSVTIGYLAVFDLRRFKNTNPTAIQIQRANADYYKDREIQFKTRYELTRTDFKKPYRFFIKVSNNAYID